MHVLVGTVGLPQSYDPRNGAEADSVLSTNSGNRLIMTGEAMANLSICVMVAITLTSATFNCFRQSGVTSDVVTAIFDAITFLLTSSEPKTPGFTSSVLRRKLQGKRERRYRLLGQL